MLCVGVVATADLQEAFTNIDYAILVGAMPRKEGMERKDLLKANCGIFKVQGKALSDFAKKSVKVQLDISFSRLCAFILNSARAVLTGPGRGQPCQHQLLDCCSFGFRPAQGELQLPDPP